MCNIAIRLLHKPHILFLPSWFPDEHGDLNGSFNLTWAKQMAVFTKVHVIVVHQEEIADQFEWREEELNANLKLSRLILKSKIPKPKQWLLKLSKLQDYAEELHRQEEFDLVHNSVAWNLGLIGRRVASNLKIPFFVTEHSTYFLSKRGFNYKKIWAMQLMRKAKGVFVVSEKLKQYFESRGVANCHLIPNFINAELLDFRTTKSKPYTFVHVTNWDITRKGTLDVLEAFIKLRTKLEAKLIVIADGVGISDLAYSKAELTSHGIQWLPGFTDPLEYYQNMSQGHCLLNFSKTETFGITIVEALKMGLHIIYTKSGGPEYFMKDTWGDALEVGNKTALLNCMIKACESEKVQESSQEIDSIFTAKSIYQKHITIYNG